MIDMDKIEKIKGWVARDDDGTLAIHYEKPRRVCYYENAIVSDGTPWVWENEAGYGLLPVKIFPDLKWEDEPLEVELTIKRASTLSEEDALPCWKKVHTYTGELHKGDMEKMLLDLSVGKGKRETKVALPDKVVDALSEEPDKSLEEEIDRFEDWMETYNQSDYPTSFTTRDIARHFAEWQAEKCDEETSKLLYAERQTAYINGWDDHKQQMLKDAVEGRVFMSFAPGHNQMVMADVDLPTNTKVRIVVLKEEEDMTEQRMQYCKHSYSFVNQGINGCAKCHQYCYYANCPDWEPITISYTVTTTTTNEKVREESWIKAKEE